MTRNGRKKIGDLYQKHRPTDEIIEDTALDLTGDGSFVEIADSATLNNISQQVTVTTWIKPTDFPNRYTPILYKGDKRTPEISNRSYALWLRNDGRVQFASSPSGEAEKYAFSPPGEPLRLTDGTTSLVSLMHQEISLNSLLTGLKSDPETIDRIKTFMKVVCRSESVVHMRKSGQHTPLLWDKLMASLSGMLH